MIPDFPKKGIMFQDITSITDNKLLFKEVINEISKYAKKNKFTKIAGVEARGFIFGAAVAFKLGLPFVPIRKKGKLPGKVIKQKYSLEYGNDEIQVHSNSITSRDRVLIVDDLIATGGTANAAAKLISKCKVKKIEFFMIIDLWNLEGSKKISKEISDKVVDRG
ncbi:MAG: adenine phosphoribosyltransferase [Candidatus Pelagibacterales bacterium]|nr:MAG: adenine phosphoribosyltransferase [Pelagibacterales bacterium]